MPEFQLRRLGNRYRDGIHLNFATGVHYVKGLGSAPRRDLLTNLFTFTGGNQSMYVGAGGLLVASATNTPRIEYDPITLGVRGLLMEAARTNLCLQSQDLGTTWTLSGATASTNAVAAPDNTTTADKLVEGAAGTFHLTRQDITISANTAYTFSFFVKAAGRTSCRVQVSNTLENTGANADFNLSAVTAGTPTNFGTGASSASTIETYPNGWYRISLRVTIDASSTTGRVQVLLSNPVGTINYSGDGASGLYMWGMQYEAGQFMSSYVPTTTASVARTADVCTRTLGTEFSATAGTVVVQGRASGGQDAAASNVFWSFDDTTTANRIQFIRPSASDTARYIVSVASVSQAALDATFSNLTAFKSAATWSANDFASSFNGAAIQTDASGTIPTVTIFGLGCLGGGGTIMNGHIKTFDYYPSRLSNNYLIAAST